MCCAPHYKTNFSATGHPATQGQITFGDLVTAAGKQLADAGYDQQLQILGPTAIVASPVPWHGAASAAANRELAKTKGTKHKPKKK